MSLPTLYNTSDRLTDAIDYGRPYRTAALSPSQLAILDARYDKRYPIFNVMDYGAAGDGVIDDTTAIQAAIAAAEGDYGGVVFFPHGVYLFSSITITQPIELRGEGGATVVNTSFGSSQWASDVNFVGTVLRSTATTGDAILFGGAGNYWSYRMTAITVVGPGTGTSVGVHVIYMTKGIFNNVFVANFSKGFVFDATLDSAFYNTTARGCSTGISILATSNASNQNMWFNTEVQYSTVDAIKIDSSALNCFYGGLIQNISGTAGILISGTGNVSHVFDGMWLEVITATNGVNFSEGQYHVFQNSYISSCDININANTCYIGQLRNFLGGALVIAGVDNVIVQVGNYTITDNGTDTLIQTGHSFNVIAPTYVQSPVGTQVTANGTITPTGSVFHVTGATPIDAIAVPYADFTGSVTLIPDSAFTTTTNFNIAKATTATIKRALVMTYDGSLWYPSY